MYQKIKVVIPVYNDIEAFKKFIDNIKKYLFIFNHDISFIIVDDSKNTDIQNMIIKNGLDKRIKYTRGSKSYGGSIIKGMLRAEYYDKLIIMDIDHPFMLIPDMIHLLDRYDVVIGNDINGNIERKVTRKLIQWQLWINVPHPTCGFMGFNEDVTRTISDKNIHFYKALSKRDIVHVEFLHMCNLKKLSIGVLDFDTTNTDIKHNYNMKRNIIWLIDLFKISLYDTIFNWYE